MRRCCRLPPSSRTPPDSALRLRLSVTGRAAPAENSPLLTTLRAVDRHLNLRTEPGSVRPMRIFRCRAACPRLLSAPAGWAAASIPCRSGMTRRVARRAAARPAHPARYRSRSRCRRPSASDSSTKDTQHEVNSARPISTVHLPDCSFISSQPGCCHAQPPPTSSIHGNILDRRPPGARPTPTPHHPRPRHRAGRCAGTIVAVGTDAEILKLKGPDHPGRRPAAVRSRCPASTTPTPTWPPRGASGSRWTSTAATSLAEMLARIRTFRRRAAGRHRQSWLEGGGWDHTKWARRHCPPAGSRRGHRRASGDLHPHRRPHRRRQLGRAEAGGITAATPEPQRRQDRPRPAAGIPPGSSARRRRSR